MLNKKTIAFKLLFTSAIISSSFFSTQSFAQYSTINPSVPDNSSILSQVQNNTETFLYKIKAKFKTTSFLGFDDFKVSFTNAPNDISTSYLTTNGTGSTCNIKIAVQNDGRIFNSLPSNSPVKIQQSVTVDSNEILALNNLKISSLLIGCGLDYQVSPFGDKSQNKVFSKINEVYKNGQIFTKNISINGNEKETNIVAIFPSFYLLYRNNYSDLLAATLIYKNQGKEKTAPLLKKYHTINKIQAVNLRQTKGIAPWESFNSYEIALKDDFFNEKIKVSDSDLEEKVKKISHEGVMMTYLLGQREQTEAIMDIQTIKQAAIIRTIQELDKDFNFLTTHTIFNRHQTVKNNLALKLSKSTVGYIKNTLSTVSGYNPRASSSNSNNVKIIIAHIDSLIMKQKLDQIASIEYNNMRKQYPEDIKTNLSQVNTVGFHTHKNEKLQNLYESIYNEMQTY